MGNFVTLTNFGSDGSCSLPLQTSIILIAIISLIAGTVDAKTQDCLARQPCALQEHTETFHQIHLALFQAVNLLLLAAVAYEKICFLELYILYTLSYVVMGVAVAIIDFLLSYNSLGLAKSFAVFVTEIAFLFGKRPVAQQSRRYGLLTNNLERIWEGDENDDDFSDTESIADDDFEDPYKYSQQTATPGDKCQNEHMPSICKIKRK